MKKTISTLASLAACLSTNALAHSVKADDHAPIGVMADHAHKKGEFMVSIRATHMEMSGNQIGTDAISPDMIVTSIPNRFFGNPMQPPTLRVVPTQMSADMVMVGAMYAPSNLVTLIAMGSYVEKESNITSYAGPAGTNVLGQFTTNPKGLGDIAVGGIFPILGVADRTQENAQELNLRAAISIPTGSLTKTAQILSPMGTQPTMRLPYMMQTGSGTWDLRPAITFKGWKSKIGYGVQYNGNIRTGTNDEGYRLGNVHEATAWISYLPAKWISLSTRIKGRTTGHIKGISPNIMGPVQTANPDFSGGDRVDLLGGVNMVATHGPLAGHRLGIEFGAPVYQDLNGPQLSGDWMLSIGWQKAF